LAIMEPTNAGLTYTASPNATVLPPTIPSIDSIVGTWSGTWSAVTIFGESITVPIRITIQRPCDIGSVCGILEMPSYPCSFNLTLVSVAQTGFTFSKQNQQGVCSTSAENDTLQLLTDETLLWIAGTGKASGILRKIAK
jgi:hypothetical protein